VPDPDKTDNAPTGPAVDGSTVAKPPPPEKLSAEDAELVKMSDAVASQLDAPRPPAEEGDEGEREAAASEAEQEEAADARAGKRETTAERKRRQRLARERERSYTRDLEARLARLEGFAGQTVRQSAAGNLQRLQNTIRQTQAAKEAAEQQLEAAIVAGDGKVALAATKTISEATVALDRLSAAEESFRANSQRPRGQPGMQPLDRVAARRAEEWQTRNSWYDPDSDDPDVLEDVAVLDALDNRVAEMGIPPRSPEYWETLTDLGRRYIPHRFKARAGGANGAANGANGGGRVPQLATGGSNSGGGTVAPRSGSFTLSREQVAAIKEAGAWDNPVKRARLIRAYRDYATSHPET
jgi:hypothetical protein